MTFKQLMEFVTKLYYLRDNDELRKRIIAVLVYRDENNNIIKREYADITASQGLRPELIIEMSHNRTTPYGE